MLMRPKVSLGILLLSMTGCNAAHPNEGEIAAIERAKAYRVQAEDCFRTRNFEPAGSCANAFVLRHRITSTPVRFDSENGWEQFSEPLGAGHNLLLRALVDAPCVSGGSASASSRERALCAAHELQETAAQTRSSLPSD